MPETLREGRLGTVGMIYNINKKSCRKRLLTYLAPYRINYICGVGVRVGYPETVTYGNNTNLSMRLHENLSKLEHEITDHTGTVQSGVEFSVNAYANRLKDL